MGNRLQSRIETWKKLLLDFGKRNRLINFIKGKRNNVEIVMPNDIDLYNAIVVAEKELVFAHSKSVSYFDYESNKLEYKDKKVVKTIKSKSQDDGEEEVKYVVLEMPGNIKSSKNVLDLEASLKRLRYLAKTSIEEQGINTLYLSFGLLNWKENVTSDKNFLSPIILVPVKLSIEALGEPYKLSLHEDEIVVNPTLIHKLNNDFGIILPSFDSNTCNSITDYFDKVENCILNQNWSVEREVNLTNLSFLKINMYNDLERNAEKLSSNSVIASLAGEGEPINISDDFNNFDHDKEVRPIDTFQVVDADSSQQDAVLLSKRGVSFVLQGPPGTGKSQTITNIIAEAMADGKKILFVSEKMAALQVVYSRLQSVGLSDFCFALHSHKVKKKDILNELGKSIDINRTRVKEEAISKLEILERKRQSLNQYSKELHTQISGLNKTLFYIHGKLAKLSAVPDVIFSIDKVDTITEQQLNDRIYLLQELSRTIGKRTEDYDNNVWRGSIIRNLSNELRHDIDSNVNVIIPKLNEINLIFNGCLKCLGINIVFSLDGLDLLLKLLAFVSKSPLFPIDWMAGDSSIEELKDDVKLYEEKVLVINCLKDKLLNNYSEDLFKEDGEVSLLILQNNMEYFLSIFHCQDKNDLCNNLLFVAQESEDTIRKINALYKLAETIANNLAIQVPNNLSELTRFYNLLVVLNCKNIFLGSWLDRRSFLSVKNAVERDRNIHDEIVKLKKEILIKYKEEILTADIKNILFRFKEEYSSYLQEFNILKDNCEKYSNIIKFFEQYLDCTSDAVNEFNLLQELVSKISLLLAIDEPTSFDKMIKVCKLIDVICEGVKPIKCWFTKATYDLIKKSFNAIIVEHNKVLELRDKLLDVFDNNMLNEDFYPILKRFRSEYASSIKRFFSSSYRKDIKFIKENLRQVRNLTYNDAFDYLNLLKDYTDLSEKIDHDLYKSYFGEYYNGVDTDWENLKNILDWFDKLLVFSNYITKKLQDKLVDGLLDYQELSNILVKYKQITIQKKIEDINGVLKNVINTYLPLSQVYKKVLALNKSVDFFIKNYKNDLVFLSAYFIDYTIELSFDELYGDLRKLNEYQQKKSYIKEESDNREYSKKYGSYYNGTDTDWNVIIESLSIVGNIFDCLNYNISDDLKSKIINRCIPYEFIDEFLINYDNIKNANLYGNIQTTFKFDINKISLNELNKYIVELKGKCDSFVKIYDTIKVLRKGLCDYDTIEKELSILIEYQFKLKDLEESKETLNKRYAYYYNGLDTNWDKLYEALNYVSKLKDFVREYDLSINFIEKICKDQKVVLYCRDKYNELGLLKDALQLSYQWFASLFENQKYFYTSNLLDLVYKIELCQKKKELLEEWVDYCSNKDKCKNAGLQNYIDKVEELDIDVEYIVDAYLKRFYRLWLDAILPQFPSIYNFRGKSQNQIVKDFCELDKLQFDIAKARVRERVLSRMPNFNAITSTRDEIGILKRELNKQRKLMPLRKLFMSIPNLITALRPCFMMSPLSVSVFLEAQSYNFDLVVFDEASQVHTEDAIGAMMRGKQVIIVGDTKQLPPTNFFVSSLGEDDYDQDNNEEEGDNTGCYDSILDESVVILPERSLRWHYRSKHEELITFSNVKFYNNNLITFPSSIDKAADWGVEYIYVSNGVYDRGRKKDNPIEAEKVANLVFEHFEKYQNRSLGVVTFSEAQQNAVEAAINKKRRDNPQYEQCFVEDREEAFFIKNLENVQGDERDTIIFSIGYAKDNNGIMYMNFGPLSRDGGYRRLNVAITRAKYNVKLVGSIVPADIDLDRTNSEGVKMLRSYIEFAQHGVCALDKELKFNDVLDFDSPFEEAVYDFLQSKGYEVVTQVGCSGFRIDMAVKHPNESGKFVIGIECDGATYHSSRTARERDRLRQQVLEDMGWTIYRIWSTDWVKNQKDEEEKLIIAIDSALNSVVLDKDEYNDTIACDVSEELHFEIEEKVENVSYDWKEQALIKYRRADLLSLLQDENSQVRKHKDIFLDVIKIEQPIHIEELYRRVAPICGRQKVTNVVRNFVLYILKEELKDFVVIKDDFCQTIDFNDLKVRVPDEDGKEYYIRQIEHIPEQELILAMKLIIQNSYGISRDDLYVETTRLFGFKRCGDNIWYHLYKAFDNMVKNGEVEEIDYKIHLK